MRSWRNETTNTLRATIQRWDDLEGFRRGAALAFYATFSIFPALLLSITVVGFLIGNDEPARDRLLSTLADPASPVREVLDQTLASMQKNHGARGLSAIVGLVTLLFSASGVTVEFHFALNRIWGVPERATNGIRQLVGALVRERLAGFAMIAAIAASLLVSLIVSAALGVIVARTPFTAFSTLARASEPLLSLALMMFTVSAAFHFVPRSRPAFRRVLPGGAATALFLALLKAGFATYLGKLANYSAYGLAGGMLALATWIYLSCEVLLFGATLTAVSSELSRRPRGPAPEAPAPLGIESTESKPSP